MPDVPAKILYVHGGGDTIGGIETFLARCFTVHKHFLPYMAIVREGKFSDYLCGLDRVIHLGGGRIRDFYKTFSAIKRGIKFVRDEKIQLIIAKGTHSWFFGGLISKLSGVPSFFYLAGDIKPEHFKQSLDAIALRIRPSLYIANSEFTAATARQYLKRRVEVVPPYPDLREFDEINEEFARKAIREEFGISNSSFLFVMPSRIQKWKGQDIVIEAFRKMKQKASASLLIVGECTFSSDEPFYLEVKRLAAGDPSIIFSGFRRDIPAIMKASDAVIHASRSPEPFGIVVAEGMMAGKPVLATEHGGPLEIIRNGINGLLYPPEDSTQLALLMDSLIEKPVMRNKIAEAAYVAAMQRQNLDFAVEKLERLIAETLYREEEFAKL